MRPLSFLIECYLFLQCLSSSSAWLTAPRVSRKGRQLQVQKSLGDQTTTATIYIPNVTDGESWTKSSGRSIKSINDETAKSKDGSWRKAIQHTNAILDMYNETEGGVTEDLVMSTIEHVIQKFLDKPYEAGDPILENVETLVWRLRDFNLVPSVHMLNALWEKQQCHRDNSADNASEYVTRQVNLLTNWRVWSAMKERKSKRRLGPPPVSYFLDVLQYVVDQKLSMSLPLWELYQSISRDPEVPCVRIIYSQVLKILAQSPANWTVLQKSVCYDMITQSSQKLGEPFWPSQEEILKALRASAQEGRAQDAAWLLRALESYSERTDEVTKESRSLFLRAVYNSSDPGSLVYMKELLFSRKWENDDLDNWKMLLQKTADSKISGCGKRARDIFRVLEKKCKRDREAWMPDSVCVYHVVKAYLNDPNKDIQTLLNACDFVKHTVWSYNLYRNEAHKSVRLFDTLLSAFDDYAHTNHLVICAVDELFRFFVIQHREGRVHEEPDCYHLGHLLRYFNRQYHDSRLRLGAKKSLEYYRLFRSLHQRGSISSPPSLFNTQQMLGTLARSQEPGFGSAANATLHEALPLDSPIAPHALGHMYWCVIRCYCTDNKVKEAISVLTIWEDEFDANPSLIRLTEAPYNTIINTLANQPNEGQDSIVLEIMERLEKQYHRGNSGVVLSNQMFQEAVRCCGDNVSAQDEIRRAFELMNFPHSASDDDFDDA